MLALDLETTGLDPLTCQPRLLIVKRPGLAARVIDLWGRGGPKAIELLRKTVEEGELVVGHNLKFDAKFLKHHYGISLVNCWDTFRASSILYAGVDFEEGTKEPKRKRDFDEFSEDLFDEGGLPPPPKGKVRFLHNLYAVMRRELGLSPKTEDLSTSNWGAPVLTQAQLDYAAEDVENLFDLKDVLERKLHMLGLRRTMQLENEAIIVEADMELAGMPVDAERWKTLAVCNHAKKSVQEQVLKDLLPNPNNQLNLFGAEPWNLDSPAQLQKSLRMKGFLVPDTAESTLAAIGDQDLSKKLIAYRGVATAVKSFGVDYLEKFQHPVTGRFHASYHPYTATGRYACRKPNLQQLPRDEAFRRCFRPLSDNRVFVVSDYSQIELRVAAQISGDTALRKAYRDGLDLHTLTAKQLTGREDKSARQIAKSANFGLLFGLGWDKLRVYAKMSYGVDMTDEEAQYYHREWHEMYEGITRWQRRAGNDKSRVIRTLGGRIRYVDDDSYTERLNTPVQGTAADGMKRAMRLVHQRLVATGRAVLVNVVHDEIVLETTVELAPRVMIELRQLMIRGMQPLLDDVPVDAEAKVCNSWSEK